MEQLSLDSFNPQETEESQLLEALKSAVGNAGYIQFLSVSKNKDSKISIKAKSILVAKIKLNGKLKYIELRKKYSSYFDGQSFEEVSNGDWIRLPVKSFDDVLAQKTTLGIVYVLVLSELGGESFGCCSRYEQCSNAKHCINPDVMMSFACAYKKNLDAGKIFYGKNKNI